MNRPKLWLLAILLSSACAWSLGYWMAYPSGAGYSVSAGASTDSQARMEVLPDDVWLHYKLRDEPNTGIGIHRTKDLAAFSSVNVFNKCANVIYTEFYEESGRIRRVFLTSGRIRIRDWSFREDGTLESETVFRMNGGTTNAGTKTYYTVDGKKEREETVVYHGT